MQKIDYDVLLSIRYICYSLVILIIIMAVLNFLHEDINKKLDFAHEEELMRIQYQINDKELEE